MIPRLAFRLFIATLTAPLAAPLSLFLSVALSEGSPGMALLAPLLLLTIAGIYGYVFAFLPVLLLGAGMTAATFRFPSLRPKRFWLGAGAFFGSFMSLWFGAHDWGLALFGAIAGAASALTYRLIVGPALPNCAAPGKDLAMETS